MVDSCMQHALCVGSGDVEVAKKAFRDYYIQRGREQRRVAYFAPKVDLEAS